MGKHHGMSNTSEYRSWKAMKSRCSNPKATGYERYGGRGIKVCAAWHRFVNFYADMGDKPTPDHSLDRINNHGHYEPSNCKWSTRIEQKNNARNCVCLTYKGETLTISQWARLFNIKKTVLVGRIKMGWTVERALTQEVRIKSQI